MVKRNGAIKTMLVSIYRIIVKILYHSKVFYFRTPRRIHKAILRNFTKNNYFESDGFKIFTDKNDDDDFFIYGFKKHNDIKEIIEKYVKENDVVIDIGANVGKVSLLLSRKAKQVFAFEPEETNYNTILRNIKLNNIKNIQVIKKAVTDSTKKTYLEISNASTCHQISTKPTTNTKEIESISLDDYFGNQKIDFIKIDAEGSEPEILRGMANMIKQNPQLIIVIEYNRIILRQKKTDPIQYVLNLKDMGFTIYDMMRNEPTNEIKLLKDYNFKEPHLTNLLCLK